MTVAPLLQRTLTLACLVLLACDSGGDKSEAPCERLQTSLCERTTECAVGQGLTKAVDADQFKMRCLRALATDLQCIDEPTSPDADLELCDANLHEISCDRVVAALNADTIVAPSLSCAEYFGL